MALAGQAPNSDAFVAVLTDSKLAHEVKVSDGGVQGVDIDEVKRRAKRDRECLLKRVHKAKAVPLPKFDPKDPGGSLDRAAAELVQSSEARSA